MPLLAIAVVARTLSRTEPFASHISRLPRPLLVAAALADRWLVRRFS